MLLRQRMSLCATVRLALCWPWSPLQKRGAASAQDGAIQTGSSGVPGGLLARSGHSAAAASMCFRWFLSSKVVATWGQALRA